MFYAGSIWTDDKVKALLALNERGKSASEMAAELGLKSRNAVISKLSRLNVPMGNARGLMPRLTDDEKRYRRRNRRSKTHRSTTTPARFFARAPEPEPEPEVIYDLPPEDPTNAIDFWALEPTSCRWPIGDPSDLHELRFCGRPQKKDHPYCPGHCQMAYRPHVRRQS